MLATAIIVFREILEAALIIGIVSAATQGVPYRNWWICFGIASGITGAIVVAAVADHIVALADGMGQEIFNAVILFAAVFMLAWHNIWMAKHGRELAAQMKAVGHAIKHEDESLFALVIVIGLAVLREGSEIVLFLHGLSAGGTTWSTLLTGASIGLGVGTVIGVALYFGLLRIPTKYLFSVTGWMILLLAAGMAAQGAQFLSQADVISLWGNRLWDTSHILSNDSVVGSLLHTLIGYDASPSGLQVAFYISTILLIGGAMKIVNQTPKKINNICAITLTVLFFSFFSDTTNAGPAAHVYSPHVEYGETELEFHGGIANDPDRDKDGEREWKFAIGHGMTTWWFSEIETEWEKEPHEPTKYSAVEWVNIFQLTEAGEYWVDLGWFTEFKFPDEHDEANKIETGPMFEKEIGPTVSNLNLIFVREYGRQADHNTTEFEYAWQVKMRGNKALEYGMQGFGETGELEDPNAKNEQEHKIGPALFGEFSAGKEGKFKFDTALLFGLTDETPHETLRFTVEYEI